MLLPEKWTLLYLSAWLHPVLLYQTGIYTVHRIHPMRYLLSKG